MNILIYPSYFPSIAHFTAIAQADLPDIVKVVTGGDAVGIFEADHEDRAYTQLSTSAQRQACRHRPKGFAIIADRKIIDEVIGIGILGGVA